MARLHARTRVRLVKATVHKDHAVINSKITDENKRLGLDYF